MPSACPRGLLENERGVSGARDAVRPGDLGQEVLRSLLADVVDEYRGHAVVVGEPLGVADAR